MAAARHELGGACLLTLAGALCILFAAGQRWPADRALGLVALAGPVALLAARRWTRLVVGLALGAAGLAVIASAVSRFGSASVARPALTLLGGTVLLAVGVLAVLRARSWPVLGARYDAPSAQAPGPAIDPWAALDRGEDPTSSDGAG